MLSSYLASFGIAHTVNFSVLGTLPLPNINYQ